MAATVFMSDVPAAACFAGNALRGPLELQPVGAFSHVGLITEDRRIGIGMMTVDGAACGCLYDLAEAKRVRDDLSAAIAKLEGH